MSTIYLNENIRKMKEVIGKNAELIKNKGTQLKATVQNINIEKSIYSNPWYFGLVELLQFLTILYILYKYNPFDITTKYPQYTTIVVLIIGFLYIALFYFVKVKVDTSPDKMYNNDNGTSDTAFIFKVINTLSLFIVFIVIILTILWLMKNISILSFLVKNGLLILILVATLSVVYILTEKTIKNYYATHKNKTTDIGLFLWKFIMFLPCLLIRLVDYIKIQYNLTTKPVWIILMLEIILICLWFIVPIGFHAITTHDGKQLISEPFYLNEEHTLGNFENLNNIPITHKNKAKFNYRYSLSGWFYINPQPPNTSSAYTKYTSLMNYGNKPDIQYNGKLNSLRIMTQTGKSDATHEGDMVEIYETKDIIYQKWNYIVINYDAGTMDVFLNGELVSSRPNIAPYMTYETVKSGSENGIQGGICNVIYYNSIMKKPTIELTYRLLRDKQIPLRF